jgi:hypothetical protein
VCLKLKTHFVAASFLTFIQKYEIIAEIPRVVRRALVSFLQKLKKNGKERKRSSLLSQSGIFTAITSSELNQRAHSPQLVGAERKSRRRGCGVSERTL